MNTVNIPEHIWNHPKLGPYELKIWGEVYLRGRWSACNYEIAARFGMTVGEARSSVALLKKLKFLKQTRVLVRDTYYRRYLHAVSK